jgi:hypothetical protein
MTAAHDTPSEVATACVEFLDTDPLIWRQVEVPTSITLKGLHDVIQAAMGWFNQDLWEFRIGRQVDGQPVQGETWGAADRTLNAAKVQLGELLKARKTTIGYTWGTSGNTGSRSPMRAPPPLLSPNRATSLPSGQPHLRTVGAFRASMPRLKPSPIPVTATTRRSPTGLRAMAPTPSTNWSSSVTSAASHRASKPPRRLETTGGMATWDRRNAYFQSARAVDRAWARDRMLTVQ